MISRSGTFSSGAASGFEKIFFEAGSGPVVTAGMVLSGLERMFMIILRSNTVVCFRHCERSEAIQSHEAGLDCFVAVAPRNDGGEIGFNFMRPPRMRQAIV